MRNLALCLLLAALPLAAQNGVVLYKSADLKAYQQKLAPKMNEKKLASQPLDNWGNHTSQIIHREGSGEAELHKTMADLFVVQSGEATIVLGGTIVDGKETAPNEIRGASIQGGERKRLLPGDILHVPANMPHQTLVDSGKQFTYFIVKIESK